MTQHTTEEISPEKMIALGQLLKETREKKGYTLSYVTEMTRINRGVLQSIENGELEGGPGPVFIRGFIRTYARLVGIEDQKIQELLNTVPALKSGSQPAPIEDIGIRESSSRLGWKSYALLLLIILAFGGGYAYINFPHFFDWDSSSSAEDESSEPPLEVTDSVAEEPVPVGEELLPEDPEAGNLPVLPEEELPAPPPVVVTTNKTTPSPEKIPQAYHLLLSVKAKELVWVGVIIDEELGQEVLLQPGEEIERKAKDRYQLTLSHTKHVEVRLNGRALDIDRSADLLTGWVISKSMLEE